MTHLLPSIPSSTIHPFPSFRGHISVAPNGRYFQDEDGKGFVVIGHNDAITWPGLEELLEGDAAPTEAAPPGDPTSSLTRRGFLRVAAAGGRLK